MVLPISNGRHDYGRDGHGDRARDVDCKQHSAEAHKAPIVTALVMLRMICFRTALAPNRCCMAELEGTATARVLSHGYDYGREIGGFREEVRSASAHADCRSISLVSAFSVCLRNTVVADSASANVHERGHDDCGLWLKVAKHRMKPYSGLVWRCSIERGSPASATHCPHVSLLSRLGLRGRSDSFADTSLDKVCKY